MTKSIWGRIRSGVWGSVRVEGGAVVTHNQTFVLAALTTFKVERPFLMPSILLGGAISGWTVAFADLLYPMEILSTLGVCGLSVLVGMQVGQLHLHGGDLRGSTLGHSLWGRYASLNSIRAEIAAKLDTTGGANETGTSL